MNNLPTLFHETLNRQFGEIIRQTEELIDKGYILMTYNGIYALLADKSEKIRNYNKFETYSEWFDLDSSGEMFSLSDTAFEIQKKYFIKTDEEIATSKTIISVLDYDYNLTHSPYQEIYYFEDISEKEGLHLFQSPSGISDWGSIWHEFNDFKKSHKIPSEVCTSYFLLNALCDVPEGEVYARLITNQETTDTTKSSIAMTNPFELISIYVAKNYIQNVISSINYNIYTDSEACSFLLKEIYKATRLYTINDIDKHITTDIPVYPYTEGQTEVFGVYYYKPDDSDVCEYLFITEKDCFSVHMKVDFPFRDWYHTTEVLEFGSVATVFGSERTITPEGLESVKGLVIGETPIRYVDNLIMNEALVKEFCEKEYNQHIRSEMVDYFIQHKGAWIQSPHQLNNNYRTSTEGMRRERFYENGKPCFTDEEKLAMGQTELEKPQLSLEAQPDESDIVYDLADKDEFDFGSPKDDNDFGLNTDATDDEPEPRKRTNRKFITCILLIPVIMLASFVYLVF